MHLLHTKEWQGVYGLRAETIRKHPFCQMCEQEHRYRSSVDVHHLRPVEAVGREYQPGEELPEEVKMEMRQRCFDPNNVIALCVEHHIEIHRKMGSHYGQIAKKMPKQLNEQTRTLADFASRITGQQVEEDSIARPKKGLRKTRFGWLTKEEYQQRLQQEREDWKQQIKERFKPKTDDGLSDPEGTPGVDAEPED